MGNFQAKLSLNLMMSIIINFGIVCSTFRDFLALIIEIGIIDDAISHHIFCLSLESRERLKQSKHKSEIITAQLTHFWKFRLMFFDMRDIIDLLIGKTTKEIENTF